MRRLLQGARIAAVLAACGLALAAQLGLAAQILNPTSLTLYALAAGLLVAATIAKPVAVFAGGRLWQMPAPVPAGRRPAAVLWLVILASVLLAAASVALFVRGSNSSAWLLHAASIVVMLAGTLVLPAWRSGWKPPRGIAAILPWAGLAVILAIGLFARLYLNAELPFGVWFDEANNGLYAAQMLADPGFRPVNLELLQMPSHFTLITAFLFQLFGPSTATLRTVAALFGVVPVVFGFLLFRRWMGTWLGLMAALIFAVLRYSITFSRIGMPYGTPPAFEIVVLFLLDRALEHKRPADWALMGLVLGISLAFYYAMRLFAIEFALFLGVLGIAALVRHLRQPAASRPPAAPATRKLALCLAAFGVGAIVASAPVLHLAASDPRAFFLRTSTVSIFEKRDEPDLVKALSANIRKHVQMFNLRGDANGRHNLPGEPMLDPVLGALAVLGMFYTLANINRPANLMMALLFWVMLLGGILSLDFEAPQSLRSIGTMPAIVFFALVPFAALRALAGARGDDPIARVRRIAAPAWAAVALVTFGAAGYFNLDTYFNRQRENPQVWLDHSAPETVAGAEMVRLMPDYDIVLTATFAGHPSLRWMTSDTKSYKVWSGNEPLALPSQAVRGVAIIMDPRQQTQFNQLRRAYPDSTFREMRAPLGSATLFYEALISATEINQAQGLAADLYAAGGQSGPPIARIWLTQAAADWAVSLPAPGAAAADVRGVLNISQPGDYRFRVAGAADAQVFVNEFPAADGPISLGRGNAAFRLRLPTAKTAFAVEWQPPQAPAFAPIPAGALLRPPASNSGLLGNYYRNESWSGAPALSQVDSEIAFYFHNTPLPRPYTVEWRGALYAPRTGQYALATESVDSSRLTIDGKQIIDNAQGGSLVSASAPLTAGWHDVMLRFLDKTGYTHVYLYWAPPGGEREIIPSRNLAPPMGRYPSAEEVAALAEPAPAAVVTPTGSTAARTFTLPAFAPPAPGPGAPARAPGDIAARPASEGSAPPAVESGPPMPLRQLSVIGAEGSGNGQLKYPRGVAVDAQGRVFVADTGNKRVVVFDASGAALASLTGDDVPFQEPVGIAVSPSGDLLVMDTGSGALYRFDPQFKPSGHMDAQALGLRKPRGISVDGAGNVFVADTGARAVVKLAPDGQRLAIIGGPGEGQGGLAEISHVAVSAQGVIAVGDAMNQRVQLFGADGNFLREFGVAKADAATGVHLAWLGDETLVITSPGNGKIQHFSNEGKLIGEFSGEGGSLRVPTGIAALANRIWVVETNGHRVLQYGLGGS